MAIRVDLIKETKMPAVYKMSFLYIISTRNKDSVP